MPIPLLYLEADGEVLPRKPSPPPERNGIAKAYDRQPVPASTAGKPSGRAAALHPVQPVHADHALRPPVHAQMHAVQPRPVRPAPAGTDRYPQPEPADPPAALRQRRGYASGMQRNLFERAGASLGHDARGVGLDLLRADRKLVHVHLAVGRGVVHAIGSFVEGAIGEEEHAKELREHYEYIRTVVNPEERIADVFHHAEELRAKIARPRLGGSGLLPAHEVGSVASESSGPLSSDQFQRPPG